MNLWWREKKEEEEERGREEKREMLDDAYHLWLFSPTTGINGLDLFFILILILILQ